MANQIQTIGQLELAELDQSIARVLMNCALRVWEEQDPKLT
jgi:hypothetical protein